LLLKQKQQEKFLRQNNQPKLNQSNQNKLGKRKGKKNRFAQNVQGFILQQKNIRSSNNCG
jgi:hypothetical protein